MICGSMCEGNGEDDNVDSDHGNVCVDEEDHYYCGVMSTFSSVACSGEKGRRTCTVL